MLLVGLGLGVGACRHPGEGNALGHAAQITRAVEMLRLSSNHDKGLWLKRLHELPCGAVDLCELQKTCASAYDVYQSAVASIAVVRRNLEPPSADAMAPDASAEAFLQAAAQAQSAQRALAKSRQMMQECAENEAAVRQRYKIR